MEIRIPEVELVYCEGQAVFEATVIVEWDEEQWVVTGCVAEETNEVFGVTAGEWFDPEDSVDVGQLVKDYPQYFVAREPLPELYGLSDFAQELGWDRRKVDKYWRRGILLYPAAFVGGSEPEWNKSIGEYRGKCFPVWTARQVAWQKNNLK